MVKVIIDKMNVLINELKELILLDMKDMQVSNQDDLMTRNDIKFELIEKIKNLKEELDSEFFKKVQEGFDINLYKDEVDGLEINLNELNQLNQKLASIVMPIRDIYTNLINEISAKFGGSIFDIKA